VGRLAGVCEGERQSESMCEGERMEEREIARVESRERKKERESKREIEGGKACGEKQPGKEREG